MTNIHKLGLTLLTSLSYISTTSYSQAAEEKTEIAGLETIVVYAQKIEQTKHDVPATLSIYSESRIEDLNIKETTDIALLTPGMNYLKADNHTAYFVYRGIGGTTTMNKIYNVNIDGVTIPYVNPNILLDTAQIEVIKGGQGALYGRNTLGGIIKVDTHRPKDDPENYVQADYGSFNTSVIEGAVGGSITETSAARIALQYKSTDGYFENSTLNRGETNNNDQYSVHGKFDIYHTDDALVSFDVIAASYDGGFDSYVYGGGTTTTNNEPGYNESDFVTGILTLEKNISTNSSLTSITSYTDSSYGFLHDWDFTEQDVSSAVFDESTKSLTQELRLQGITDDEMNWLLGAFFMKEEVGTTTDVGFGADAAAWGMPIGAKMSQSSTIDNINVALFGQAIYPIGQFELSVRMRLDYDKKSLDWQNNNNMSVNYENDWFAVLPAASISWKPTDASHTYLSVSRGYKAGDYNNVQVDVSVVTEAVAPEYSITYELGHKQRFGQNVEMNVALYYIDWTDIQVDIPHPDFQGAYIKQNAAGAHSSGLELELLAAPMTGVSMFLNGSYPLEYEFDDFSNGIEGDYTGNKLPYTNEYSLSLGSSYTHQLGLFVGADVTFKGPQFMNESNTFEQGSYAVLNAQIGYRVEAWSVYLYGRNLTDEEYSTSMFNGAESVAEPRFIGLKAKFYFE
ncbi:TonB-dependent receptor [Psychromonas hadalis]|uniref:TonB-dependent receptor n=1 Tax=Psychromonas hadalis TaxID=211669 RepID=UPI0003B6339D|nr:TonB-dependent receptor [Psychromonas hadalis]